VKELARLPSANHGLCARYDTLNCNPQVLKVLQAEVERRRSLMRLPQYTNNEHRKTIVHGHIDGFGESARMEYFDESPEDWIASSVTYLDHRFVDILRLVCVSK
jgi:hypothetical protein